MTAIAPPPLWPSDPGHRAALDTLLVMAEAEARWGESRRARELLDNVEQMMGSLPPPFERIRSRCDEGEDLRPPV